MILLLVYRYKKDKKYKINVVYNWISLRKAVFKLLTKKMLKVNRLILMREIKRVRDMNYRKKVKKLKKLDGGLEIKVNKR